MFERFDDDEAFSPSPAFRTATLARGRRLRRRRILARTGLAVAAALVVGIGAVGAAVDRRLDGIDRTEIDTVGPPAAIDGPVNVLVAGLDGPLGTGARPDAVAVVRVDPAAGVTVVSIPRDLAVSELRFPVSRLSDLTDPSELVAAVEEIGIPVDHVVTVEPDGFVAAVDAVGGVPISVPVALRDRPTGLDLAPAACTTLDGEAALALVRARHVESLVDGTWRTDPTGDLGRIARQQVVAAAALGALAGAGADPAELWGLSGVLADHAVLDGGFTDERLVAVARTAVASGAPRVVALPVEAVQAEGAAVLRLVPGPVLDAAVAAVGGPPAPSSAAADVPEPVGPAAAIHPC